MKIGVLSFQGGVVEHLNHIKKLGHIGIEVKKEKFNGLFGSGVIEGKKVILLKPQTFMNASGECVEKFAKFYKIEAKDIITIFDDIDKAYSDIASTAILKNTRCCIALKGSRIAGLERLIDKFKY